MYLSQRLETASPEQLAAILLEGGQKFLILALAAMESNDIPKKARYVNRVSDFISEMTVRLNPDGGEAAANLKRLYKWWTNEVFAGARSNQPQRLELVLRHMGEMRATWEERHRLNLAAQQPLKAATSLDLMVG
jgi:flagellar biosynthetic protein FliS